MREECIVVSQWCKGVRGSDPHLLVMGCSRGQTKKEWSMSVTLLLLSSSPGTFLHGVLKDSAGLPLARKTIMRRTYFQGRTMTFHPPILPILSVKNQRS